MKIHHNLLPKSEDGVLVQCEKKYFEICGNETKDTV